MSEIIGISRNELPPYLTEWCDGDEIIEDDTPLVAHKNAESLATMTARWKLLRLGRVIKINLQPKFVGFFYNEWGLTQDYNRLMRAIENRTAVEAIISQDTTPKIQNPTHKPDGHSMTNTLAWLTKPALAREYGIIGKCYVKRGGVSTQTAYNIIGKRDTVKPDGTPDVFYELRCPVTGGTIGRLSNDIEVVS